MAQRKRTGYGISRVLFVVVDGDDLRASTGTIMAAHGDDRDPSLLIPTIRMDEEIDEGLVQAIARCVLRHGAEGPQ